MYFSKRSFSSFKLKLCGTTTDEVSDELDELEDVRDLVDCTDFLIEATTGTCFSSSSDEDDDTEGVFGF